MGSTSVEEIPSSFAWIELIRCYPVHQLLPRRQNLTVNIGRSQQVNINASTLYWSSSEANDTLQWQTETRFWCDYIIHCYIVLPCSFSAPKIFVLVCPLSAITIGGSKSSGKTTISGLFRRNWCNNWARSFTVEKAHTGIHVRRSNSRGRWRRRIWIGIGLSEIRYILGAMLN